MKKPVPVRPLDSMLQNPFNKRCANESAHNFDIHLHCDGVPVEKSFYRIYIPYILLCATLRLYGEGQSCILLNMQNRFLIHEYHGMCSGQLNVLSAWGWVFHPVKYCGEVLQQELRAIIEPFFNKANKPLHSAHCCDHELHMCAANFSKNILPAEEFSIEACAVKDVAGVGSTRQSHREKFAWYLQLFPNRIALEKIEHGRIKSQICHCHPSQNEYRKRAMTILNCGLETETGQFLILATHTLK